MPYHIPEYHFHSPENVDGLKVTAPSPKTFFSFIDPWGKLKIRTDKKSSERACVTITDPYHFSMHYISWCPKSLGAETYATHFMSSIGF